MPLSLPPSIRVERIPENETLTHMLYEGGTDALFCARVPLAFEAGDLRVRRLFPDYCPVEEDYFRPEKPKRPKRASDAHSSVSQAVFSW